MLIKCSVRQLLKRDFAVDLPIAGGNGNSVNNPVIIESQVGEDYHRVEHDYVKYICIGRRVKWEFLQCDSLDLDDRKIERVKIRTQSASAQEGIAQTENYYFDITDCVIPPTRRKRTYRDFSELINELEARDTVFRSNLQAAQRREKPPWIATFGKGDLQKEDEALWQNLFDGKLTEEDALAAMTDLMERYYGRPYPLNRSSHKK